MRKKLLPAICCTLLMCSNAYADETDTFEYDNGKQTFVYDGYHFATGYDGEQLIGLDFLFTNNSSEATYFDTEFYLKPFQNGIELSFGFPSDYEDIGYQNSSKALKDGASLPVTYYFELEDSTSPIDLTVMVMNNFESLSYMINITDDNNKDSTLEPSSSIDIPDGIPTDYDGLLKLYLELLDKYNSLLTQIEETSTSEIETSTEETEQAESSTEIASSAEATPSRRTLTTEDYIQANLRSYVSDYDYTTIDSITINDDAGTDTPDDYIALVNLTWSQKNSQETTEKMLDMYSQDMAARIYKDSSNVQEICIFWSIPYLNASAKWSFERGSNGMYKTDQIFSK